jgi:hypothetical protein
MFHMNQNLKVVLAVEPVDLRKSFNGLYAIARNELGDSKPRNPVTCPKAKPEKPSTTLSAYGKNCSSIPNTRRSRSITTSSKMPFARRR